MRGRIVGRNRQIFRRRYRARHRPADSARCDRPASPCRCRAGRRSARPGAACRCGWRGRRAPAPRPGRSARVVSRGWAKPSMRSLSSGSLTRARLAMAGTYRPKTPRHRGPDRRRHLVLAPRRRRSRAQRSGLRLAISRNAWRSLSWKSRSKFSKRDSAPPRAAGALQAGFDVEVQNQSEIGLEIVQHDGIDAPDGFARQPAARALIGIGGIGEAVARSPICPPAAPDRWCGRHDRRARHRPEAFR